MHSSFSDRWAERTRSANTCKSFGNGSSPSLPPISPKQMAAFGKALSGPQHYAKSALHRPSSKPPLVGVAICGDACELSERCLHMDYSLSHDHKGTRPCSTDHGEAVRPVGSAEDRVIPFGTSFAMLASHGHAPHPMGGGQAVCT